MKHLVLARSLEGSSEILHIHTTHSTTNAGTTTKPRLAAKLQPTQS